MRSAIIAGGLGFIGSHLSNALLKRNDLDKLVVVDNLWTGSAENELHLRDPRVSVVRSDVEAFRTDQMFDEIYHLASPASPN